MARSSKDNALSIFKAGISAVPVIGGPVASLIGDYVQSATQQVIEESVQRLRERLETLSERIDASLVSKDEFASLFKSCYLVIIKTHDVAKLEAAASLITNVLLKPGDPEKLEYNELDHFVRCLDTLSIGAILVLANTVSFAGNQVNDERAYQFDFDRLHRETGGMDSYLLMGLVGELGTMGLFHLRGVPSVRTENYGNYPIEVTPLGYRFVKRLLPPVNGKESKE